MLEVRLGENGVLASRASWAVHGIALVHGCSRCGVEARVVCIGGGRGKNGKGEYTLIKQTCAKIFPVKCL